MSITAFLFTGQHEFYPPLLDKRWGELSRLNLNIGSFHTHTHEENILYPFANF
ncbi:hypothetical protein [Emticicia sp. 17c]|uniref:hypothetical protein n=1 Tax=Emticicia sp. 17c TaxID=3127704 RepID=UPI00301D312B